MCKRNVLVAKSNSKICTNQVLRIFWCVDNTNDHEWVRQLLEKQRENNAAYSEFLEEKRLIDAVIAKVKAEQRAARLEVVAR